MKRHLNVSLCALCALCGSFSAQRAEAQSRQVPAPPQNEPIAIVGAMIHPVSAAPINEGYVVFEKGKITALGAGAPVNLPRNAVTLNGRGLHVYPGLISSSTYLGLTEIGAVDVTNDHSELGNVKPEVRAAAAINPDSDLIPVTRANGILTALIFPRGGLVSGRCSTISLDGWTWEDMAIDAEAGLVLNWPRTETFSSPFMQTPEEDQRRNTRRDLDAIDKLFDEAAAYVKAEDSDPAVTTDLRYEAMRPALAGAKPIYVSANSAGQIESAIAWANRRGVKIVIVGGTHAEEAAPLLKKHDVPVIVVGTHRMPQRRHDAYDDAFTLPKRLHEAGVRFCIATGEEAAHERNLNHMAATAAAYGLPKEEALKAVTLSAANILGLGATHGSLEPGKAATLIVTTGDPLEITTDTVMAFIDGRQLDLGDRQKTLYAKYQEKYRQLGLLPPEGTRQAAPGAPALPATGTGASAGSGAGQRK